MSLVGPFLHGGGGAVGHILGHVWESHNRLASVPNLHDGPKYVRPHKKKRTGAPPAQTVSHRRTTTPPAHMAGYGRRYKRRYPSRRRRRSTRRRYRPRRRRTFVHLGLRPPTTARAVHYDEIYKFVNLGENLQLTSTNRHALPGTTVGGINIYCDRLSNAMHVGSDSTGTTFNEEIERQPTNEKTMLLNYDKYSVVKTTIVATYYNILPAPVNEDGAGFETLNKTWCAPLVVGGYVEDGNNVDFDPSDWFLKPRAQHTSIKPQQHATFKFTVYHNTMHGNTSVSDNELSGGAISSRAAHPTDIRLVVTPISAPNATALVIPDSGLWHIRSWKTAVWSEPKELRDFSVTNQVP